ncbi:MAG: FHA domain-containing protein, partial [Proteobacteria bacterium]|nr:FHA domain-containing protein [Pseudomonadota bacterium]
MLKFEILSPGDGVSRVVEIGKSPIKVGKLSTSDLSMDDASVSRMHARIEASGGVFRVVDLGSAGGTYVNDQKVMAQQFYSGDVLRFGNVRVRCTQAGVSVPLPVPPIPKPVFSANRVEASGVGFSAPPATPPRLIRRKKKGVSFERRFLSERCPKGEGSLEIAHMWR